MVIKSLHTASKSSKGGTVIYVNKYFDSIERSDLNINYLECESTWIEIKNKRSKNIDCEKTKNCISVEILILTY